ncbi:hypothetical protein MMC10_004105 [Thelotrema lepadinum]|nr:hypothetical protein [Thelotrema lepadinum]
MSDLPIRVLCLHGHGSNARILKAQMAALRHELGHQFEWVYVEGTVPVPMADDLKPYYPEDEQTFAYCDLGDQQSVQHAFDLLEVFINEHGPFPLIGAQSGSASLAGSLFLKKARAGGDGKPITQGAVFFSPIMPVEYHTFPGSKLDFTEAPNEDAGLISIPTLNVWGSNDSIHATHAMSMSKLCRSELHLDVIHANGSAIPGAGDEEALINTVHAIRRTADRAISAF